MKFIGVIDKDNQKTPEGTKLFTTHDDAKFGAALAAMVEKAYSGLFELHANDAWTLDRDTLISYFRGSDETSAVTGSRQALTFQTLASLALKRQEQVPSRAAPGPRAPSKEKKPQTKKASLAKEAPAVVQQHVSSAGNVGLTVRIEINLPANGSQATYDNIFQSIRKNLIDGSA